MTNNTRYYTILLIGVLLALLALAGGAAAQRAGPSAAAETLTGRLSVILGDPMPVEGAETVPVPPLFVLQTAAGDVRLSPGAVGADELLRLGGREVIVTVPAGAAGAAAGGMSVDGESTGGAPSGGVPVAAIATAPGESTAATAVTGNTRWLTVACKFGDVADEPRTAAYLDEMYRNSYPGLDHYWREVSYGQVNLSGSKGVGWYTLPKPRSGYMWGDGNWQLSDMTNDCLKEADADVNFLEYEGINVAFNANFGCCAYGTWAIEWILEGERRTYRMTWLPPWAYTGMSVVQHEMGHGYGMLHSANFEWETYGNAWDVMGADRSNCSATLDPVYGCIGQYPIAYHTARIGWLPPERIYEAGPGTHTVTLERTALPTTDGYLMARVPIDGSADRYYTLEVRRQVSYDAKVPTDTVIIHDVIADRNPDAARIFDDRYYPYGSSDRAMWMPGESFASEAGNIIITFDSATATGATITIHNGTAERRQIALPPLDDTSVRSAMPDNTYGAAQALVARSGTLVYMKLDAADLPETTTRVVLRMNIAAVRKAGGYGDFWWVPAVYRNTSTPWTEEGLTWNNKPVDSYILGGDEVPPTRTGNRVEWDITRKYRWWYWEIRGIGSFPIAINPDPAADLNYSSKEGANPPQLVVDYMVLTDDPGTDTHTFTPTNDAYVTQAKPKNVFGSKAVLQVKDAAKDVNTYVKFNVNGLDGTVQSATLRLWVNDPGPDGGAVYAVSPYYLNTTTLWLETGLKWNNAPVIGGAPLDVVGNAAAGQWVELDVTAAVVASLADNGRVSLAVTNDSRNLVTYSSKEGAHPPELVVITN